MTDGLYEAYEAWTHRPAKVNEDIAHLVAREIKETTEFHLVAQKVVEKVKTVFLQSCKTEKQIGRLDDITLIIRNFGYPHLSHSRSHPEVQQSTSHSTIPATAPVMHETTQANNVFFNPTTSSQNLPYFSNVPTQQSDPYQDYSAASLPPSMLGGVSQTGGYSSAQQQPYPNNAQPSYMGNGAVSMGGGGFYPEPNVHPEYTRQGGYTSTGTGQSGYTQTNDWYSSQGPLSNAQVASYGYRQQSHNLPHTASSQHPPHASSSQHRPLAASSQHPPVGSSQHPPLAPTASYPIMSHPQHMGDRQQSVPAVKTQYRGDPPYSYQQQWTNSSQVPPTDYRRVREYENTNPLGTDHTQNEQSASRSSVYENVHLPPQDTPPSEHLDYSAEQLEEKVQKMSIIDTPQKQNESSRTAEKKSPPATPAITPSTSAYTPSTSAYTPPTGRTPTSAAYPPPAGRKTPIPTTEVTTPVAEEETTPKLTRRDSEAENLMLYGWSVNDSSPTSHTDKDKNQYDTLREDDIPKPTPVAEPKFFTKVEPPVEATPPSQNIPMTLQPEEGGDEDVGTIDVDMKDVEGDFEAEPSDHESEDFDGDIRSCVKFSTDFPDISWDDIKV